MKLSFIPIILIILLILLLFLITPFRDPAKEYITLIEGKFDFNFWSQLWIGFFSALFFTIFLFFINERLFKDHDISGVWILETETLLSTTLPGYKFGYKLYMLKKGSEIVGKGEKVFEINTKSEIKEFLPFNNAKIVYLEMEGYFFRRYLKQNIVKIFLREEGVLRDTIMIMDLRFKNERELIGTFSSTAACTYGNARLKKVIV